MHEVLVNRLGGLSLPRKSVVRLTDRPDITLDVYHGRKTTIQQQYPLPVLCFAVQYKQKQGKEGSMSFKFVIPKVGHLECQIFFQHFSRLFYLF